TRLTFELARNSGVARTRGMAAYPRSSSLTTFACADPSATALRAGDPPRRYSPWPCYPAVPREFEGEPRAHLRTQYA
ncbi:MAG: hypothetical protein ACLPKT_17295, partial [Methylocella sp.]